MNKQKVVHPDRDENFDTGAYSDGIIYDGLLYLSGQATVDFKSSSLIPGTIEEETRRTLDNIKAIVEKAGAKLSDTLKSTVHLSDINDFEKFNEVYETYFEGIKPARTTVQSGLAENIKVEIDVIVKLPKK